MSVLLVPRPMALRQKSLAWESRCLKEMNYMLASIPVLFSPELSRARLQPLFDWNWNINWHYNERTLNATRFDVLLAGLVPRRRRKKNFQNLTSRRTYCEMIFFCACSFAATFPRGISAFSQAKYDDLKQPQGKWVHSKEGFVYVI